MVTQKWTSWLEDRHYDKAPIKEAIIDIQIENSSPLTLEKFDGARAFLPPGYAERRNVMVGHFLGQVERGTFAATAQQDHMGYAFIGGEGKHVAQFRVNGFTFSRIAPYQSWKQLREEASLLWKSYQQMVGAVSVVRVGLRYVNQLDLPLPMRDFRDFLRSYPEVSPDLPQGLAGFFMQIQIPQIDIGATLVLSEALVPPPPGPEVASVVLDIDIFKQGLKLDSDGEVWELLDVFRKRKNLIFEGSITNNTRELIS